MPFPDDLLELNETQKGSLRVLWQPCKYDLALEIIWRDVENDLFEGVVLMVMDVAAIPYHTRYCEVVLKVLYLEEPPQYEYPENEAWTASDEISIQSGATGIADREGSEPEKGNSDAPSAARYLSKKNCLPLLDIGQMIEILGKHKAKLNINLTPEEAICYMDGKEFDGDELCDTLWEAVKTLL